MNKKLFLFVLILPILFFQSRIVSAQVITPNLDSFNSNTTEELVTNELDCEVIKTNLEFRQKYYNINTENIITKYQDLNTNTQKFIKILDLKSIESKQIEENRARLIRNIQDIESLKNKLTSLLEDAKKVSCSSDIKLRRDIRESKLALSNLKQKISETNSFIVFNIISDIRNISTDLN